MGHAQYVDCLKSVNCMYRRSAVFIPDNLRGFGAQVHNRSSDGIARKSIGWKLVYGPKILVQHYAGPRFDDDARSKPTKSAISDAAYNLTFTVGSCGFARTLRREIYALLIGDRALPGVGRTIIALIVGKERGFFLERLGPALRGNIQAGIDLARGRRVTYYENGQVPYPETICMEPGGMRLRSQRCPKHRSDGNRVRSPLS